MLRGIDRGFGGVDVQKANREGHIVVTYQGCLGTAVPGTDWLISWKSEGWFNLAGLLTDTHQRETLFLPGSFILPRKVTWERL